jgi:cation:H+ antiporter
MVVLFFLLGLALLVIGANVLVKGSSRLASAAGVSPLVIGLTVVAFGTSAPELAISVKSAYMDQANLSVGNVIGSNIFNTLLILGLSALITPLAVSQQLVRLDVPLMIGVSGLVWWFASDGHLHRLEGGILFSGLVLYIVFLIRISRREGREVQEEYEKEFGVKEAEAKTPGVGLNVGWVLLGLVLLVLGSKWLVESSIQIARYFQVSELVIGLTIVAAGTSLPEVVTSVVASLKGERDIAVGNVIGSNLFNAMGVLGVSSLVAPAGLEVSPAAVRFDIPVMIAVAVMCLPVFFNGFQIQRWEGALFLFYYIAYTLYLILGATQHTSLPLLRNALLYVAIPLTVAVLLFATVDNLRRRGRASA